MIEWIEIRENRDLALPHQWQARVGGRGVGVLRACDCGCNEWQAYVLDTDNRVWQLGGFRCDDGAPVVLVEAKEIIETALREHGWRQH